MVISQGINELSKLTEWRRYQSTLSLILAAAAKKLFPNKTLRIEHSMSKGFYCRLGKTATRTMLKKLEHTMRTYCTRGLSIQNKHLPRRAAIRLFQKYHMKDKLTLLQNCQRSTVNVSKLLLYHDSYESIPYDSTDRIKTFRLIKFSPGFIILFPGWQGDVRLPKFSPQPKLARIFNEYEEWARILGITDVGHLNQAIRSGEGSEIIKISEALHEKKIAFIADCCVKKKKRLILIAGPSSAGKTTFTKRLSIQMLVNGIRPLIISADNYFLPHSKTPRDEHNRLDFESLYAVDIPLLNKHLLALIKGKAVVMPRFNFITGRRNKGKKIILPEQSVILLEGIHCLNPALTPQVPSRYKFKIYISALTQLNIDNHNRISTTDSRMLRRVVRDTHFRGYGIREALRRFGSIRSGEEKNIYPYQEEADEMFNSALMYEPSVLRKYFVPIARRVKKTSAEYPEARRLIRFMNLFYDLMDREIPSNSILREFIGGSSFLY